MACTVRREHRLHHIRSWTLAFAAIAGWLLLVSNVAEAQQIQVPEIVLAQVLGPNAERDARLAPAPLVADPGVALVAVAIRDRFEDQLVAGVARPSVELEVHFEFDSVDIDDESGPQIEAAAAVLVDHFPETRFRVAGYTDAAGSDAYNQKLSERRAAAVTQRLVDDYGVPADRLESIGFGEDASAEESDAQRRRVELQILRGADRTFLTARD